MGEAFQGCQPGVGKKQRWPLNSRNKRPYRWSRAEGAGCKGGDGDLAITGNGDLNLDQEELSAEIFDGQDPDSRRRPWSSRQKDALGWQLRAPGSQTRDGGAIKVDIGRTGDSSRTGWQAEWEPRRRGGDKDGAGGGGDGYTGHPDATA